MYFFRTGVFSWNAFCAAGGGVREARFCELCVQRVKSFIDDQDLRSARDLAISTKHVATPILRPTRGIDVVGVESSNVTTGSSRCRSLMGPDSIVTTFAGPIHQPGGPRRARTVLQRADAGFDARIMMEWAKDN